MGDHLGEKGETGRIISKLVFRKQSLKMWTGFEVGAISEFFDHSNKCYVPIKGRMYFIIWTATNMLRRLFHGVTSKLFSLCPETFHMC
jgi:hypothetical protein